MEQEQQIDIIKNHANKHEDSILLKYIKVYTPFLLALNIFIPISTKKLKSTLQDKLEDVEINLILDKEKLSIFRLSEKY